MSNVKKDLLEKIVNKTAVVGMVGLGYVGLPLAVEFAKAGYKTIGKKCTGHRPAIITRTIVNNEGLRCTGPCISAHTTAPSGSEYLQAYIALLPCGLLHFTRKRNHFKCAALSSRIFDEKWAA